MNVDELIYVRIENFVCVSDLLCMKLVMCHVNTRRDLFECCVKISIECQTVDMCVTAQQCFFFNSDRQSKNRRVTCGNVDDSICVNSVIQPFLGRIRISISANTALSRKFSGFATTDE
jgi:hypothetical protein